MAGCQIDVLPGDISDIILKKKVCTTLDVSELLSKIKCPVLALNGTKDTQVDCTANTIQLERGLTNCKHTIKKVDGVNHLFQHCTTGNVVEYQQIEETIAPEVLQTVTKWINSEL